MSPISDASSFGWILANSNRDGFEVPSWFQSCFLLGGGPLAPGIMTAASMVVVVINLLLQSVWGAQENISWARLWSGQVVQVLIAMAKFERSLSNNDLNKSMMQKIFLAQTLNIGRLGGITFLLELWMGGAYRWACGHLSFYVKILKMTLASHTVTPSASNTFRKLHLTACFARLCFVYGQYLWAERFVAWMQWRKALGNRFWTKLMVHGMFTNATHESLSTVENGL